MADSEETTLRRASCLRLLAHDLNNPLTAIRILAEMVHEELTDEEMRRDMGDVLEAADLASALIDGMSSMLRLEGPEEEYTWFPMNLGDVLREAVNRPALRSYVALHLPQELRLGGDRRALQRAFTDLFVNARRLGEGEDIVAVTARESEDGVEVVVRHPGKGVPAELREQMLQLHGSVDLRREHRIPVAAVGLAYVHHVIGKHNGELVFRDDPGGALEIVVHLPR